MVSNPRYQDEHADDVARSNLEQQRWGPDIRCPLCGATTPIYHEYREGVPGYYRCRGQPEGAIGDKAPLHMPYVFTVRTGTIMQRSHIALSVWERALALVLPHRHALPTPPTAFHLSLELELTEKSLARLTRVIRDMDERFERLLPVALENASRLQVHDRDFLQTNFFLMVHRATRLPDTQENWFSKDASARTRAGLDELTARFAHLRGQLQSLSTSQ